MKRRADKAERLLATFQPSTHSPSTASPPGASRGSRLQTPHSEAARKAILDVENRAEQALNEARLCMVQVQWTEFYRWFAQTDGLNMSQSNPLQALQVIVENATENR